jgi:hypothetical protein
MNVAVRSFAKISLVGFLRFLVPIGRKNALASRTFKGQPESANAAEQIYEPRLGFSSGL